MLLLFISCLCKDGGILYFMWFLMLCGEIDDPIKLVVSCVLNFLCGFSELIGDSYQIGLSGSNWEQRR